MAKLNLGRVGLVPKGTYDNTKTYAKMDVVFYPATGSSYVSLADDNSAAPSDATRWQSLADVSNEVAAANAATARANTAAEAAEGVSGEVADLKSAIDKMTGLYPIDMTTGGYVAQSAGTANSFSTNNSNWMYAIIPCEAGQKVTINGGGGGGSVYAFMFVNSSYTILDPKANAGVAYTHKELTAPENTAYLIVNNLISDGRVSFLGWAEFGYAENVDQLLTWKDQAQSDIDEFGSYQDAFDTCLQENSAFIDLSVSNILQPTTKDGCYAEVLTGNTPKLRLTNNSTYKSFYFIAAKPIDIYYDATTLSASGFVAIATLENPSALVQDSGGDYWYGLNNERPVRYRLSDGNLPSVNNKLHVSTGTLVVASYQTNITIANASKIYVEGLTYELTDAVSLQESQIKPFLQTNTVAKTTGEFVITNGNARYYVNYYNNNSIRANLWRTNKCEIKTNNGSYFTLWNNSDSDGVVQLGEDDFIGGYHGDEIQTLVHMYVDGAEIMPTDTFGEKAYKEIVMMFTSNVYHCNTSQTADSIAFIRNKILIFNENGFTVKNYWVAQEDLNYLLAYMGMLSVERFLSDGVTPLIKGYYTNEDYLYKDNATATARSEKVTNIHFVTAHGDASISIKYPLDATNRSGHVQDYNTSSQQRLKAYLGYGYGVAIPLATGEVLQAEATILI